jgi:hypothetical protein
MIRYSSEGKVFFQTFSKRSSFILQSKFVIKKQINTTRGYCWGPSYPEGPQKSDWPYVFSMTWIITGGLQLWDERLLS